MSNNFKNYNLNENILKALSALQYETETPVQSKIIPLIIEGHDLVVQAQTGSGKTAAFAIPLLNQIDWLENSPQILVISPTRELAQQVADDFSNIGRYQRSKAQAIFGKDSFAKQTLSLKQKTHVVVGTPGRLIDHIKQGSLDVSKVKYLVIDEADQLFKMGFLDQTNQIIEELPAELQMILVSATFNEKVKDLVSMYMNNPQFIEVVSESNVLEVIDQSYYEVDDDDKLALLDDLLIVEKPRSVLIFATTQVSVDLIQKHLDEEYGSAKALHGGMYQKERTKVIDEFKKGLFHFLVASDVAARGLDIVDLDLIINYDLPLDTTNYIHRIGRTGRANQKGKAISLVSPNQQKTMLNLCSLIPIAHKQAPTKKNISDNQEAFNRLMNTKIKAKDTKGSVFSHEISKIHISGGKKQKMRTADILGAITSSEAFSFEDVGIIKIEQTFSLVEILNNKGQDVVDYLETNPIKGKLRKIGFAKKF